MSPFMLINSQLNIPRILLSPKVQGCIQKLLLQPEFNHLNTDYTKPIFIVYLHFVSARNPPLYTTPLL